MIPASERLYDAVVQGRLVHPTTPSSTPAHGAIAKHSRRGWRLDEAERAAKIDAVVALATAVDALEHRPEPVRLVGWL